MLSSLKRNIPESVRTKIRPLLEKIRQVCFVRATVVKINDNGNIFKIHIDPKNGAVDRYIFWHKIWEPQIGEVIQKELPSGGVFVDVGANIGYFSMLAATIVGPEGSVYSFEPIPRLCSQLKKSAAVNNFTTIHCIEKGCGAKHEEMTLHVSHSNIGGSSVVKKFSADETCEISVTTLDSECVGMKQIDVIKIDVEGFEYEVLLGAEKIITQHSPKFIIELSPSTYEHRDSELSRKILTLLDSYYYNIFDIDNQEFVTDIDSFLDKLGKRQTNLFCTISNEKVG